MSAIGSFCDCFLRHLSPCHAWAAEASQKGSILRRCKNLDAKEQQQPPASFLRAIDCYIMTHKKDFWNFNQMNFAAAKWLLPKSKIAFFISLLLASIAFLVEAYRAMHDPLVIQQRIPIIVLASFFISFFVMLPALLFAVKLYDRQGELIGKIRAISAFAVCLLISLVTGSVSSSMMMDMSIDSVKLAVLMFSVTFFVKGKQRMFS